MNHPTSATINHLSDEQMGNLIAGVANHEAKAIVLGGMELGKAYGITALHHLFVEPQGEPPAHRGGVNNQMQYCTDSFERVGCVAKVRPSPTLQYEITPLGDWEGKAVSGHFLELSADMPDVSLRKLWGMTKNMGNSRRAPFDRLLIYRSLFTNEDIQTGEIAEEAGIPYESVAHNLRWLDKHGIIEYKTINPRKIDEAPSSPRLGGRRRSDVVVSDGMRRVLGKVIEVTSAIQRGESSVITTGRNKLSTILSQPEEVRGLVAKAYLNSPEANPTPKELRFRKVANFLIGKTGVTTGEIAGYLEAEGMTHGSVTMTLKQMRKHGKVESILEAGENIWTLTEVTSTD